MLKNMITLLNSFSIQVVPLSNSLGNNILVSSFSAPMVDVFQTLGSNKLIETSSIEYKNVKDLDRIIRYK